MLNKQEDKTHRGRFSSSKNKQKYNGTTFTHLCGDIVPVKNRLYPDKIASVFCGEASHTSCERGCKERCLGKGTGKGGEQRRESHGKRQREGVFMISLLWGMKLFKAGVQKCIRFQIKPCC